MLSFQPDIWHYAKCTQGVKSALLLQPAAAPAAGADTDLLFVPCSRCVCTIAIADFILFTSVNVLNSLQLHQQKIYSFIELQTTLIVFRFSWQKKWHSCLTSSNGQPNTLVISWSTATVWFHAHQFLNGKLFHINACWVCYVKKAGCAAL